MLVINYILLIDCTFPFEIPSRLIRLEVVIPENSYHFHMLGCAHYSGTCHLWEE